LYHPRGRKRSAATASIKAQWAAARAKPTRNGMKNKQFLFFPPFSGAWRQPILIKYFCYSFRKFGRFAALAMETTMKRFALATAMLTVVLLCGNLLGDTFLQGLGGSNGLQNEGNQGASYRNDRFYTGADRAFIGQSYDWSGVGLSSGGSWATMISATYFLSANHDHPGAGQTITFHTNDDPNGPTFTYTVANWSYQTQDNGNGSDLYLGELTAPVDSSIAKYPVVQLANDAAYNNLVNWTYGYPNRVGKNNISSISDLNLISSGLGYTRVMYYTYNATGGQGFDESYLEGGDWGGPSFVMEGGLPALVGIHFVNSGAVYNLARSGDSFVPFYISQLDANMSGGEQLTIVPEPASLSLLALGGLALLRRAMRRRK
jgi:hypothetical protein